MLGIKKLMIAYIVTDDVMFRDDAGGGSLSHRMYLIISFRKSTPPQNRQLIIYYDRFKYQVDGLVGELTF